jgi:hypothetical protein
VDLASVVRHREEIMTDKLKHPKRVPVMFDVSTLEELRFRSQMKHISVSEIIRIAVRQFLGTQ